MRRARDEEVIPGAKDNLSDVSCGSEGWEAEVTGKSRPSDGVCKVGTHGHWEARQRNWEIVYFFFHSMLMV